MQTPDLSVRLDVTGIQAVLRVDQIRHDTLMQLVQQWADTREDVIAALDHLAEVMDSPRSQHELDAAVDAVDEAGCMEYPEILLSRDQVARLQRDMVPVADRLLRPVSVVPAVREEVAS